MIGNNACGPHAVAYGRTADNVQALTVVDGTRPAASAHPLGAHRSRAWTTLVGAPPRGASGPSWAGSAGRSPGTRWNTCCPRTAATWPGPWSAPRAPSAVILDATVRLVPISPARMLVVLGYPDMASAADAVPACWPTPRSPSRDSTPGWSTWSGRARAPPRCPTCRAARGWLMIEVGGETRGGRRLPARRGGARRCGARRGDLPAGPAADRDLADPGRRRRAGRAHPGRQRGLAGMGGRRRAAGERLGAYLREFEDLMRSYGVDRDPVRAFR